MALVGHAGYVTFITFPDMCVSQSAVCPIDVILQSFIGTATLSDEAFNERGETYRVILFSRIPAEHLQ